MSEEEGLFPNEKLTQQLESESACPKHTPRVMDGGGTECADCGKTLSHEPKKKRRRRTKAKPAPDADMLPAGEATEVYPLGTIVVRGDHAAAPTTPAPVNPTPEMLLSQAIDKGADPDALNKLMDLAERVEANNARKAYAVAFADFQAKAHTITKDSKGAFGKFASFEAIAEVLRGPLAECGLSYSFERADDDNNIAVQMTIMHRDGFIDKKAPFSVPVDNAGRMNASQKIGSGASYAKRYAMLLAFGLSTGEFDDDGQGTKPRGGATGAGYITGEQAATLAAMMDEIAPMRQAAFLAYMDVLAVEEIRSRDYGKAANALNKARQG